MIGSDPFLRNMENTAAPMPTLALRILDLSSELDFFGFDVDAFSL